MNNQSNIKSGLNQVNYLLDEICQQPGELSAQVSSLFSGAKKVVEETLNLFAEENPPIGTIHILQREFGGIPQDPEIFIDVEKAHKRYEQLLVSEGFREKKTNESVSDYGNEYWAALEADNIDLFEKYPKLDRDNTIRWWDLPLD